MATFTVADCGSVAWFFGILDGLKSADYEEFVEWMLAVKNMVEDGWAGCPIPGSPLRCLGVRKTYALTFLDTPAIIVLCGIGWGVRPDEATLTEGHKKLTDYLKQKTNKKEPAHEHTT